jgi:hypothetical protein
MVFGKSKEEKAQDGASRQSNGFRGNLTVMEGSM